MKNLCDYLVRKDVEGFISALQSGQNPNIPDDEGITAIFCACQFGMAKAIELLARANVDVNQKDSYGNTPIFLLARSGEVDDLFGSFKSLVKARANANILDKEGRSVLHYAVAQDWTDIVLYLLENGANPNQKDNDGESVLMWAAEAAGKAIVEILLDKGAAINERGGSGYTALIWAASRGKFDVVRLLLENGINQRCFCKIGAYNFLIFYFSKVR